MFTCSGILWGVCIFDEISTLRRTFLWVLNPEKGLEVGTPVIGRLLFVSLTFTRFHP